MSPKSIQADLKRRPRGAHLKKHKHPCFQRNGQKMIEYGSRDKGSTNSHTSLGCPDASLRNPNHPTGLVQSLSGRPGWAATSGQDIADQAHPPWPVAMASPVGCYFRNNSLKNGLNESELASALFHQNNLTSHRRKGSSPGSSPHPSNKPMKPIEPQIDQRHREAWRR